MVPLDETAREFLFRIHGMALGLRRSEEEEIVLGHEFVRDAHEFSEHGGRGLGDADIVIEALGHLVDAVESLEEGHQHDDLLGLPFFTLEVSADEDVEELVGPAEFDIGLDHDGVPSLDDGVLHLVEADGIAAFDAVPEVLAMEHLL